MTNQFSRMRPKNLDTAERPKNRSVKDIKDDDAIRYVWDNKSGGILYSETEEKCRKWILKNCKIRDLHSISVCTLSEVNINKARHIFLGNILSTK